MSNAKNLATFLQSGGSIAGDANFDSNTLFVDSSANRVGIGTNSPSTALDVTGTITSDGLTLDNNGSIIFNDPQATDTILIGTNDDELVIRADAGDILLKTNNNSTSAVVDASGNVGIGTSSPSNKLDIKGTVGFEATNSTNAWLAYTYTDNTFRLNYNGAGADEIVVTSGGNVGIGSTSPDGVLEVSAGSNLNAVFDQLSMDNASNEGIGIEFSRTTSTSKLSAIGITDTDKLTLASRSGLHFYTGGAGTYSATSERMRIDSNGNLLVGTTDTLPASNNDANGFALRADGNFQASRSGAACARLNRGTSDGEIMSFHKDGTTVGSIGTVDGDIYVGTGDTGLFFSDANNEIRPYNTTTQNSVDNAIDIGRSASRFKDLYLGGRARAGGSTGSPAFSHHTDTDTGMNPDGSGNIQFTTQGSERMRIDSSGNVGIGLTSPQAEIHTHRTGSSESAIRFTNGITGSTSSDGFRVGIDINEDGVVWMHENEPILFGTNSTERMRIQAGGGISFNGDSAAANALSDYEEGTYTTSLVAGTSGSIFMTTGSSTLSYVKVGDIVHIQGYLRVDSVSSPTGRININLPFTCKSGNQYRSAVLVSFNSIASGNIADMWAIIEAGSSQIHIYMGDGTNVQSDAANAMQAGSDVRIQATYQVA